MKLNVLSLQLFRLYLGYLVQKANFLLFFKSFTNQSPFKAQLSIINFPQIEEKHNLIYINLTN